VNNLPKIFQNIDKKTILGTLLVFIGTLFGTTGQTFIKISSSQINPIHAIFWRSISGFIILFFIYIKNRPIKGFNLDIIKGKNNLKWYILRGLISTLSALTLFVAIAKADISEIGTLSNINPIFTVFIAYFLLNEKLSTKIVLTTFLGITGVFLIRNPFVIGFETAHLLVLFSASLIAFDLVLLRKLNILNFHYILIIAIMLITGFIFTLPIVLSEIADYTPYYFILIFSAGTFDLITQIFFTKAARYISSGSISMIALISVFEFMIWGSLIFNELVTNINIMGGLLIIISAGSIIYLKNKDKKRIKGAD